MIATTLTKIMVASTLTSYKDFGCDQSYTDFGHNNLTHPIMVAKTLIKIMVENNLTHPMVATTADIPLLQEKDARNVACGQFSFCKYVFFF